MTTAEPVPQIDSDTLAQWRQSKPGLAVLDVREPWEFDICAIPGSHNIPMSQIPSRLADLPAGDPLVVMCHHGGRSMQVTQWLRGQGVDRAVNLAGGIDSWAQKIDPTMARY